MSTKPIAQVAISTIKTSAKQDIYPKTIDKAVVTSTTDPDNGSSTTLDKVIAVCKDKEYSQSLPNGLGRHVLKKNIVNGSNILTSDTLSTPNTEYYIQYDFDLNNATITLPTNSTLYFIGGSLKNGTLIGQNTRIVAPKGVVIFDNVTIQGTWDVDVAWSSWFKTHKTGYKIASVVEIGQGGVTKYQGNNSQYYEFSALTAVSNAYFVKSKLTSGTTVNLTSVFVPSLTTAFYRGSDDESYEAADLTSVSDVNFVKSTLGVGSNVVESSVFVVSSSTTVYKGTDKNYYTSDEVTLVSTTYYVTSTLVDGAVVSSSIATTAVTAYLGSNGKYYESSALQSVSSTKFVTETLDNSAYDEGSVFAVEVYKANNNQYYSLGNLVQVSSTYFVTNTLDNNSLDYDSVFIVPTIYPTFRIEGDNTDYVAAPLTVPGTFDAGGYAQYDDTAALQSLFDLRAKKCVIEDGTYIIDVETHLTGTLSNAIYTGLFYDNQKDAVLEIDGWLKVLQNDKGDGNHDYHALEVIGCENVKICGCGGIQGDLLEHNALNGAYGHNFVVANTKNLTVEGLTFSYAWGDCIYCHWNNGGKRASTPLGNTLQGNHTFKNVRVIYGGRTGLVYELGDNVLVDSCYFSGCGRARGKSTYSAVDIEPFAWDDTSIRYVRNFEFKNNTFKDGANGLRLERCVDCSVHDNIFDSYWTGVFVIWHNDVSYNITNAQNKGWIKSRMAIYNNQIRKCNKGISLGYSTNRIENVNISTNTFVSCTQPFYTEYQTILKTVNIYSNTLYGCGKWYFNALVDCDIHGNRSYACNIPNLGELMGGGWQIYINTIDSCSNSKFHDNWFSLDYNKSFFGLGEDGKEEKYHGLPVANGSSVYVFAYGAGVSSLKKDKIHFYDNHTSDDFYVNYSGGNTLSGGINSVRTEDSNVFLINDTFKSKTYGDEGRVISGAILSQPVLEDVRDFADMSSTDTVVYGEIIKNGDYYYICNGSGTVGATWGNGTATFVGKVVQSGSAGTLKIAFTTRGICTSETRPDSFLFAGRKMWETDTNKEIMYNGTTWVEISTATIS